MTRDPENVVQAKLEGGAGAVKEEDMREVAMVIEAFARHLHEDTGPWGQNKVTKLTGETKVGASPIGYCTWEDAPEDWRETYRARAREKAGIE